MVLYERGVWAEEGMIWTNEPPTTEQSLFTGFGVLGAMGEATGYFSLLWESFVQQSSLFDTRVSKHSPTLTHPCVRVAHFVLKLVHARGPEITEFGQRGKDECGSVGGHIR